MSEVPLHRGWPLVQDASLGRARGEGSCEHPRPHVVRSRYQTSEFPPTSEFPTSHLPIARVREITGREGAGPAHGLETIRPRNMRLQVP